MEIAKRRPTLSALLARISAARVTRCVLGVPHKNNFAAAHSALLEDKPMIFAQPLGFIILHLRVALAFSERNKDF